MHGIIFLLPNVFLLNDETFNLQLHKLTIPFTKWYLIKHTSSTYIIILPDEPSVYQNNIHLNKRAFFFKSTISYYSSK